MRIRAIRLHAVRVPRLYTTRVAPAGGQPGGKAGSLYGILEVEDGAGRVGLGEVSDMEDAWEVPPFAALRERCAALLLGADPADRRRLLHGGTAALTDGLHPELGRLLRSAVETALLDLTARAAGLPLTDLLGGRCRDRVAVTWVAYLRGVDDLEPEIRQRVDAGCTAFKLKVGQDLALDGERVALTRRLAGPRAHVRLDASGSWDPDEAVDCIHRFADLGADAVETPLQAVSRTVARDAPERVNDDPEGAARALADLRRRVPLQLIEHVADFDDAFTLALAAHRAVDAINVIPVQAGGLLRAQRLLQVAEAAGLPALLGSTVELGVGTAAAVHLAAASSAVTWASDLVGPGLLTGDVVRPRPAYVGGALPVPSGPGLGVALDAEALRTFAEPAS